MKVAFCLYGLSGGYSERLNKRNNHTIQIMEKSYESYKKNILEVNKDVCFDIYFHTRKHKNINKIIEMYKPKKYIVDDKNILKDYDYHPKGAEKLKWNIALFSRYDSTFKVLNLVEGDYDYIFLCRFDLTFLKPLYFKDLKIKKNNIYFPNQSHMLYRGAYLSGSVYARNPSRYNNLEWKQNNKNEYLNEWWFIFHPDLKEYVMDMEKVHSSNLNINIHHFFAQYFSKKYEIVLSSIKYYDTPLTRDVLKK
tara:strand:+ start:1134 stop:1886 length:753 start_codon:yes stop_codon:yes gene_type:complete